MNWYYAINNEQKGPVPESDLNRLLQEGAITTDSLVWREGMTEWQPYSAVLGANLPPVIAANPNATMCADCHRTFTPDELVSIGGRLVCSVCKPLAVQRLREGVLTMDSNAEQIRKLHINHEASIKSVGTLYLLGGIGFGLLTLSMIIAAFGPSRVAGTEWALSFLFLLLAGFQLWTSFGLRKLKRSARICAAIISGLGLLSFPFGTLINGYILYLLFSTKGSMVFSDEYQNVIAATPHIKYRTSILVWILLGIVILLIFFGLGAAIFGSMRR